MFVTRTSELALLPSPNREIVVALAALLNSCAAAAQMGFNPEPVVDSTDPMEGAL